MKIHPKKGIDKLLFGMKEKDVKALYGEPDKRYEDEEDNVVFLYDKSKLRLTFYTEEDSKLGYIIGSDKNLEVQEEKVIGREISSVKEALIKKGFSKWTMDTFDSYENYFNEENWIILQTEFGEVVKFEIGAMIENDEFDWKF